MVLPCEYVQPLRWAHLLFLFVVPGYVLDRVLQPSAPHVPSQTHPLWFQDLQHEDEALMDWVRDCVHVHVVLQMYMVILLVQNENVARASTSEKLKHDPKRPDRRTPRRALVEKSFHFTHHIWEVYMTRNRQRLEYVCHTVHTYTCT